MSKTAVFRVPDDGRERSVERAPEWAFRYKCSNATCKRKQAFVTSTSRTLAKKTLDDRGKAKFTKRYVCEACARNWCARHGLELPE